MASRVEHLVAPLKALATLEQAAFDDLLAASASVAAGAKGPEALRVPAHDSIDGGLDAAHQGLVALFLESAKAGVGSDELATTLAGVLPQARSRAVAEMLTRGNTVLRGAVEACGFGPAQVVDASWQRCVVVASKHQPQASGALYVITLTTRLPDGTTRPLQFTANVEQLADLVGELKSAVKQVERER